MKLLALRVALLAVGIIVWGYGVNTDNERIRWIGIAVLASSLVLRFFRPRPSPDARDRSDG